MGLASTEDDGPDRRGMRGSVGESLRGLSFSVVASDRETDGSGALQAFVDERSWVRSLYLWLQPGLHAHDRWDQARIRGVLDRDIAQIDQMLTRQVNAILHHPSFRRLEAAWHGIRYLALLSDDIEDVKVRILQISWSELCRDLERAIEFDQSSIFQKIYSDEFGMPGGRPFGLLIGDYEVMHRRTDGHATDDVAALKGMSQVAAAAFAPFIVGVAPAMLGLDSFRDLAMPVDLAAIFRSPDYVRWKSFRENDDARFIGLTLPRVLMRVPYRDDGSRTDGFRFQENIEDPGGEACVWGPAVYAFASIVMRAFASSGWFADLRGARQTNPPSGGLVVDLPVPWFETDRPRFAGKFSTDVAITDRLEKEFSDLGFIPLMKAQYTDYCVFYSNQSVQAHKNYQTQVATINARLSTMLQYMLCVSRFAHYLKVLARDRVGSFATPEECQVFLQNWLRGYCNNNVTVTADVMARYPLREGSVQVRETPGRPGIYQCTILLRPHSQVDQIVSEFKLVTELMPREPA
jgi:type VI secretion system protein ImpD